VGSILDPNNFLFTTAEHMRIVNPEKTVGQFSASFPNDGITAALRYIASQQEYKNWKTVRNTLAHRSSPGRSIHVSEGEPSRTVEWVLQDIPIDIPATASRREWLADSLRYLITQAYNFTANYFILR
jgi:hypothetical protein